MNARLPAPLALCLLSIAACGGGSSIPGAVGGSSGQQGQLVGSDAAVSGSGDASGWTTLGNSDAGGAVAPNAAYYGRLAVSGGVPYAIYSDYSKSEKLTVMKLTSGKWTPVGSAGFTTESTYYYTLYVDGTTPYVAFVGYSSPYALTVMKYNGSAWVLVGNAAFASTSGYGTPTLAVSNGIPYVAFLDTSSYLHVMSLSGSAWVDLGGAPVSTYAYYCTMTIFNGTVYVAYNDENKSVMNLVTWSGTAWTLVAQSTYMIEEDWDPVLTVNNGTLFLIYYNYTYGVIVWKLSGSTLVSVGTLGSITNGDSVEYVSGTVNNNGVPFVAYDDESRDSDPEPRAATVKYFDATTSTWQLFAGYPNPCDIENTFIAADQTTGQIYLTYSDCSGYMTVQVH
jgi:hypothetical protein